jgi:hypothetical protein
VGIGGSVNSTVGVGGISQNTKDNSQVNQTIIYVIDSNGTSLSTKDGSAVSKINSALSGTGIGGSATSVVNALPPPTSSAEPNPSTPSSTPNQ